MNTLTKPAHDVMTIEEFLKIPTFSENRAVVKRSRNIAKILSNPKTQTQTHFNVDIVTYIDKTGEEITQVVNGNTRKYIWQNKMAPVPTHLIATKYNVKDEQEAKVLYDSFDSDLSVEKNPAKVTGQYRKLGLEGAFNNNTLANGNIVKALEAATMYDPNVSDFKNVAETVSYFADELLVLDEYMTPLFKGQHIALALILLKRYTIKNSHLLKGLKHLGHRGCYKNDIDTGEKDGVFYLWTEWDAKKVVPEGNDGTSFPIQLDFMLYCMTIWMDKEFVTKRGYTKCESRKRTYVNYWNDEE